MKFPWLITLLLIAATSCTNQSQAPETTESLQSASPTPEALETSASVPQNDLPTIDQPSANATPSPNVPATSSPEASQQAQSNNCDPAYPDVCIPPSPPDLDCGDISERNFRVLAPDPHRFDGRDKDGIGCEE